MTFESESGISFVFKRDRCWVGADALYRLNAAEAHQIGQFLIKWSLSVPEEVGDDLGN